MPEIKLSHEEEKRLKEIDEALDWRFPVAIKDHFNEAGKLAAFAAEPTRQEKAEQRRCLREMFGPNGAMAAVRNMDIFVGVARRVGTDEELAPLLPAGKFQDKDAELLDKCELHALAALVRKLPPPPAA